MGNKIVAITGRPNVGKSTLFNRLIGKRKAIVDDVSGVTRDRQYDYAEWNGQEFVVIDTGGYVENTEDIFETEIKKQVKIAVEEADVVLFMVDIQVGITDLDESFARMLRKFSKKVIIVANKADNFKTVHDAYEFYKLGFEEVIPLSSINGSGTGELLDKVVEMLQFVPDSPPENNNNIPKFAVTGRPNVGKSTFVNSLLGEDRSIVSEIPGTTRDSIHSVYNKFDKTFIVIDTAGLRKKSNVHDDVEFYSVMRAVKAIDDCDICFVIIDANEGLSSQDLNIISLAEKRNKGIVILVNKWDIYQKETNSADKYSEYIKKKIAPFTDIPIVTISALNKQRIMKAVEEAFHVFNNKTKKISTSELNKFILPIIEEFHPPSVKGKMIKIKYVSQLPVQFPAFVFFTNHPQYIKESYKRFLENKLREEYDFSGVPLKIIFRKK